MTRLILSLILASLVPSLAESTPLAARGEATTPGPGGASPPLTHATGDTLVFPVLNHGRPAGTMTVARAGDELRITYAHVDRNRGRWLENRYRIGSDGAPVAGEARPMTREGEVGEPNDRFTLEGGEIRWARGSSNQGAEPAGAEGAFFRLNGVTPWDDVLLVRYLLAQPGHEGQVVPGGTVRLEVAAETVVNGGTNPERLRYVVLHGMGSVPRGLWIDDDDGLAASAIGWFITVRPDLVESLDQMRVVELAWRDREAEALAAPLLREATPAGPVVIRGGDVFDAREGRLLENHTVVVEGDRVVAVGPSGEVAEPAGARIIEAVGHTVMPGLWDMHVHLQATTQSDGALSMLAAGLTTVRDLVADLDVAVSYRDRVEAGRIVGPRAHLAGFIEGPGAWAGPGDAIAATEEEARAWVARYHALGYRQIKLYNLVHPDLVPAIAEETRNRGMRLSGHVPRGLSTPAAVRLGFDEINHAAFLFSSFFPDSLYIPEMRPYSAVAAVVAPGFDVESEGVTEMIQTFVEHGTVIDGTFVLWMGAGALRGEGNPGAEAYARMIQRLHEAGVTFAIGTDNTRGSTFVTELELHEFAGIPSWEVLRMATLGAAEIMGEDAEFGTVEPGKVADLLVVEGRPTEGVEALRELRYVMQGGRVYTPEMLRGATRP